mmetsp:Transcript_10979/g.18692  ORF Transcript_10979/g.18692 Transcript_10979/m.18692 type:complete len:145 (+) Transcript_10979:79-513(+)
MSLLLHELEEARDTKHLPEPEEEFGDESDESDDEGYDSDDPERWGPYYWSNANNAATLNVSPKTKAWDYMKFASFKTYRNLNFAGEVLVHFFGLDSSPYQWMMDAEEKDLKMRREEIRTAELRESLDKRNVVPSNQDEEFIHKP